MFIRAVLVPVLGVVTLLAGLSGVHRWGGTSCRFGARVSGAGTQGKRGGKYGCEGDVLAHQRMPFSFRIGVGSVVGLIGTMGFGRAPAKNSM